MASLSPRFSRFFTIIVPSFCRLFIYGFPPGSIRMPVPDGWPRWLIRHPGKNLLADEWLADNFEFDRSTATIQEVNNIRVSRVAHYKDAKGDWRHEFIIVTLVDGSRGDMVPTEPLYLRYERSWAEAEGSKKERAKIESSRASSVASDQPVSREDIITPLAQITIDKLNHAVKRGKQRLLSYAYDFDTLLREMTFPSNPTVLDLAAVLDAHSTLSTEYRLYAIMCYWYAGSTYEVLRNLYNGHNVDSEHSRKAGKLGIITGYRVIREKQDAQNIGSLVDDSVKKQLKIGNKDPVSEEELEQVAKAELERIPKFEALRQRSIDRKDQAMAVLEQRESERVRAEARGRELETQGRELEAKDKALEEERAGRVADRQRLEVIAREREEEQAEVIRRLREQLEALQPAGSSNT